MFPQSSQFNNGLWSSGEKSVKKEFLTQCFGTKTGHIAILITGAVPAYLGNAKQVQASHHFKLGTSKSRMRHLTVPSHMWTQAICLEIKSAQTSVVVSQTSD